MLVLMNLSTRADRLENNDTNQIFESQSQKISTYNTTEMKNTRGFTKVATTCSPETRSISHLVWGSLGKRLNSYRSKKWENRRLAREFKITQWKLIIIHQDCYLLYKYKLIYLII